jgi:hypothetical protein
VHRFAQDTVDVLGL